MNEMARYPALDGLLASMPSLGAQLPKLCMEVQQIAAPTGDEGERAAWVAARLVALGAVDVTVDDLHNVVARIPGLQPKPALLVTAHTDTVFGPEVDLSVRQEPAEARIYGPGIGDNSMGVAGLVALAELLMQGPPPVDIWLAANSGEEGLGDLKGMRAVVDRLEEKLGACVVIEGMGLGRVVHRALASRRYRILVEAPGGHSWSDFGTASAIHVLAHLAHDLTRLRLPEGTRSTFNIGRIEGGTSVNSIAQNAMLELDLRSEEMYALAQMVAQVEEIVYRFHGTRWMRRGVNITAKIIGDRPAGAIQEGHPLVQAAVRSLVASGFDRTVDLRMSSTDANVPLSRGIPAVCVGITEGGNAHRREEWISTVPVTMGMGHLVRLVWWAAGWLAGGIDAQRGDEQ
jgi:tripeptide aminopeptidase